MSYAACPICQKAALYPYDNCIADGHQFQPFSYKYQDQTGYEIRLFENNIRYILYSYKSSARQATEIHTPELSITSLVYEGKVYMPPDDNAVKFLKRIIKLRTFL
jgi:hypothetical protein